VQEYAQKNSSQQKFAQRICLQHRKTARDEKPCWLGWINTMAKCLASSQSEHGWRGALNGLSRNDWKVLGRTLLGHPEFLLIWVKGFLARRVVKFVFIYVWCRVWLGVRASKPAFVANLFTRRILLLKAVSNQKKLHPSFQVSKGAYPIY
jgi:hypothetical protein